jgi:hypothetical protein
VADVEGRLDEGIAVEIRLVDERVAGLEERGALRAMRADGRDVDA